MIEYQPAKYKEFAGTCKATVLEVGVEANNYYNPSEENSTKEILNITFSVEDKETLESSPFTQKFVSPLTGGKGLFQQLLDCKEVLPDENGGELDEQELVGLELLVEFGKNKKGYATVNSAVKAGVVKEGVTKKKEDKPEVDLPF